MKFQSVIWRILTVTKVIRTVIAEDYEFSGGTIKQIALKAAFKAVKENSLIAEEIIRELCEFECGNNLVGFRKKTAPMGLGK